MDFRHGLLAPLGACVRVRLIIGLGNPGRRYNGTRHNVGFDVLDEVAARRALEFSSAPAEAVMARTRESEPGVMLAKPLTFMNLSGTPVSALVRYYRVPLDDLLIVAEDVNLPLGRLRARARGSDGGHNGLRSVIEALGTQAVSRLRIGVGRGDTRRDLAAHVLARFEVSERPAIREAVVQAADAVEAFIVEGIDPVMNRFNGSPGSDAGADDDAPIESDEE